MNRKLFCFLLVLPLLAGACKRHKPVQEKPEHLMPVVSDDGQHIEIRDPESLSLFESEVITTSVLADRFIAPAKVGAMVTASHQGAYAPIVLFDDPGLSSNYSSLLEHQISISRITGVTLRQYKIELERTIDLKKKNAATEKDVLEAQTLLATETSNLESEKAALIEDETQLQTGGYDPQALKRARPGTIFIICDIPENQLERISIGMACTLTFAALPNRQYEGKVDDVAEMVDPTTRMIKVRVVLQDKDKKLKAGMYGNAGFDTGEASCLSIPESALVTIQGKHYVFVEPGNGRFERRQVTIGTQVGNRIIIYTGLQDGEQVVTKGVMQLKGLSFGY